MHIVCPCDVTQANLTHIDRFCSNYHVGTLLPQFTPFVSMKFAELRQQDADTIRNGVKRFDTDGRGYIPTKQLGNVMRYLKLIPTNREIEELEKSMDAKNTGFIRDVLVEEVLAQNWPASSNELEKIAWNAFLTFDKKDQGRFTSDELRFILMDCGLEPIAEKDVIKIIRQNIDPATGFIQYGYLIWAWLK